MRIHRLRVDDWERYRDLRVAALADTPEAFGETLAHARDCGESDWRARLSRMQGDNALGVVGVSAGGSWMGTMRSEISDGDAWVYGVYVAPEFRGSGVAHHLLTTVSEWASHRATRLLLHVATTNAPARRLYESLGFVATGQSVPNPAHSDITEMEMARSLRE